MVGAAAVEPKEKELVVLGAEGAVVPVEPKLNELVLLEPKPKGLLAAGVV